MASRSEGMDGSVELQSTPVRSAKVVLLSMALYLAACALPALIFHVREDLGRNVSVWSGYRSDRGVDLLFTGLVMGWMRLNFTAFSNLLLWISWIALARRSFDTARLFSLGALIWSVETLQLVFQPMLWNEGAVDKGYLVAPHIGCVLWIASMLVIYLTSGRLLKTAR